MSRSTRLRLAWLGAMTFGIAGLMLTISNEGLSGEGFTPHSFVSIGYASVGALICFKRPHRIGTLFLGFGLFAAVTGLLFQVCGAEHAATADAAAFCSADAGRLGPALWPASYMFLGSLFLLFPSGTLPSKRWAPVAGIFLGSWGGVVIGNLVAGEAWVEEHAWFLIPLAVWALALVVAAPLFRIRRASAIEKQQLRWLGYAIGLCLLLIAIGIPLDAAGRQAALNVINTLVFVNVALGIPAAITVAILRYRLYDIDLILNRTLVYGALTAILALCYLGLVVLLQGVLRPLTPDSDLAVAGSTLAVAAMFRPLRSRLQTFIDHRFYRRKYDAAETLHGFSSQLRDQVDLDALARELVGVVATTMRPAHASLWLRSQEAAR